MRKLYAFLFTAFVFFISAANKISAQNYNFTTSAGNVIVPGITLVPGSQGDDVVANIPLPFSYSAYGTVYNSVNASSNGNLQFTTANTAFFNTCPLPDASLGVAFFPYWDDLRTDVNLATEGIFTSVSGFAPNRIFNIEWRAETFSGSIPTFFEVRFFEGHQRVDYIYAATPGGVSASIGVQSPPTLQTTFSCNTAATVSSGLGISFILPPVNDLCSGAININCGQTLNGSTVDATIDPVSFCGTSLNTAPGVWYSFVGDGTTVTLSLCGSSYDTKIGVFSGSCGSLVCVTGNDDFCGLQSQVTFATVFGTNYYILVTGFSTATGAYTLARTCVPPCSGVPSPGLISGPSGTVCSGSSVTLTLSGYSPGTGITFQWKSSSTSGGPYTTIPGATSPTYTFACNTTAYFICTVTCSNSGLSANTTEFVLNVSKPVHSNIVANISTPCSPGAVTISATVSGGVTSGNYTHLLTGPGTIGAPVVSGPNNSNVSFTVTNVPAGNQVFTLRSTDAIGCFVVSTIPVTINTTPLVTITPAAPVICAGAIQALTAIVTIPGQNYSMTTSTGNSIVPGTTLVPGSRGDDVVANIPLPFSYSAYGTVYNSVNASSNGNLQFTTANTAFFNICPLPAAALGVAFHPHWDDLHTGRIPSEGVFTSTTGSAPNRIFNIEWRAELFSPASNAITVSFEVRIFEGQQRVDFIYGSVQNNGGSASIGVQSQPTTQATTFSCNTGGLSSGLGISFVIPSPAVTFTPLTELYTDAGATMAYTGTPVSTIYAKPAVTRTYTASYTTPQNCTNSANVTVTVNQLPAITAQPVPLAAPVCPGFNVTYSITATGTGITYQWQVSTDGGATWTNTVDGLVYAGSATNSLTILNVSTGMTNYKYRCVVSGTCPPPATSNAVTLVVATPPVINTQPANVTICANTNASFSVVAAGIPAPTIYQWQVSTDGGATWTNLTTGGSYTPTFTITAASIALSGNKYRVIVTNSCGQNVISNSATLTVNPIPVVVATDLSNQRICISDTLVPLVGTPVGGTWTGIGVSGFNFIPTATAVGTYVLTYTYTNSFGCTVSASTTVKVVDCPERERLLKNDAVILYPNPNNGMFNIRMNSTLYNYLGMRVYDMTGRLLTGNFVTNTLPPGHQIQNDPIYSGLVYGRVVPIDMSKLPAGTYLAEFYYNDGVRTSKKGFLVVIQH